ncbi:hypothetical protein [Achromobacter aloeverae]
MDEATQEDFDNSKPEVKYQIQGYAEVFETQEQSNWCWIACACNVGNYYYTTREDNTTRLLKKYTQSRLYKDCTGITPPAVDEMELPPNHVANQTGNPVVSLGGVHAFGSHVKGSTILDVEYERQKIQESITRNEPVLMGLGDIIDKKYKHVIVFFGFKVATEEWNISDPMPQAQGGYGGNVWATTNDLRRKGVLDIFYSTRAS